MSARNPLRRAAGEVLIAGLEGPRLSATEAAWLRLIRPAGVILFRRNIDGAAGTHALLTAAKAAVDAPLLRLVDVEGGSVDRLRDLIAPMPSPAAVAATGDPALFALHGERIGAETRLLGFNATLAPVLDLRTAQSERVLAGRVAAASPDGVVAYARAFLRGLRRTGVLGCGKHFPGLGGGRVDSHETTPTIAKPLASLWAEDLLPYRRLVRLLPMVMISHARYPLTPSGAEPASLSRFWIDEVLRRRIGYRGPAVSDDLEMGGVLSHAGIGEAAVGAILAGTRLIEICRDPARIFIAYEALLAEAEASPAFARRLRRAAAEAGAFRTRRLGRDRLPPAPSAREVLRMRSQVERFSRRVERAAAPREGGRP